MGEGTKALVQFSTGAGSAEVAYRAVAKHGRHDVVLITADTMAEDEDNWRFAREVVTDLGDPPWVVLRDGRTPMQVGMDEGLVPNNRMAVCSRILKREIIRKHMDAAYDPADSVVYLGFDWTEQHRLATARPHWEPWAVEAPLCEPPFVTKAQVLDQLRERGIEPPRLYERGFSHANCGGACVRGGQAQWELLLRTDPERYRAWERDEQTIRDQTGKDISILRDRVGGPVQPLTLSRFRVRLEAQPSLFESDDWGACGCSEGGAA